MFKQCLKPRQLTTYIILVAVSLFIYTVSQAAYWNETRRTEHGREGTVFDSDIAEEGGAYAFASVDKNYEERTVRQSIIFSGPCPLGSQCPFEYPERPTFCDQCRVSYLVHKFGTEVGTCSQVSCPRRINGNIPDGSWGLLASEHQQPSISGSVSGPIHRNHYKTRYYEFKKPDDLTGTASGSISPVWDMVVSHKFSASTEFIEF